MNWPDWSGDAVVIVASGPSASDESLEPGKGKARFLAVKDAWKLCPWADILYGCDHHWWEAHRGVPEFLGLRLAYDARTLEKWRGLAFERIEILQSHQQFLFEKTGQVGWGLNSGFHAINLAAQFGSKHLILVGFDMSVKRGNHFFGSHPYMSGGPSAANVERWAHLIDKEAPRLTERGIRVVNCSAESAITAFPKMSFEEAIEEVQNLHRV